ncbi:hypothetical protein [Rhodanobacter sp. MP7CTX1]|uniref:hypothetical protein n=1 Tax=Rhodanobacter sp. MP7CTX1 TaxID=2723084 RepID=UPI00161A7534|nr:hypothetical protein [Rhodanobacter sp. MP7CTX1]MBB6189534.1 hypothetical protein [Rhodanobacter sp. MP7CTX1]
MKVRLRTVQAGCWMFVALAAMPARGASADAPQDARAQMRAAMNWLATPWDDAQEKAL